MVYGPENKFSNKQFLTFPSKNLIKKQINKQKNNLIHSGKVKTRETVQRSVGAGCGGTHTHL
jgi:hypothetical protein